MKEYRAISSFSAVVMLATAVVFLVFPVIVVPAFAKLLRDFGGEVPLLTRIALKPTSAVAALLFLGVGGLAGVWRKGERPLIWSLTAGGGVFLALVYVLALYLPIFTTGQIK